MFAKQTLLTVSFVSILLKKYLALFKLIMFFAEVGQKNPEEQKYFDDFYEEVFAELERKVPSILKTFFS